jgi:hypothetical protein
MAVNLNDMGSKIKDILGTVPGIASAFDHEPQNIDALPAVTLYFDNFSQYEITTRRASVNWNWTVRIYIDLNTSDLASTQLTLRNLITDTLKALRANISLNGSCLFHTVANGDVFNILNVNRPMMVAELTLTATTEESY